jgi:UDP-GlcNAc:undecaprenyl-phosphate GlcNAc-1-phosphate transferase
MWYLLLALLLSSILVKPILKLAQIFNIVDVPNLPRKTQILPVPYLGGVSVAISFVGVLCIVAVLNYTDFNNRIFYGVLLCLIIGFIGLLDDLLGLGALSRIAYQILGAVLLNIFFINLNIGVNLFQNIAVNILFTLIWFILLINSFNFIDNIDGASSGILIISSFTIAMIAHLEKDGSLYLASIILAGACLGFIFWNWHPAKIYLGDAGSYFLGSIVALNSLLLNPAKLNFPSNILLLILIFAVPLIDISVALISRIRRRAPIYIGGRDHFSHRLLRLGFTTTLTTVILLSITLIFNFLAISLYLFSDSYFGLIFLISTILFFSSITYLLSLPDED